MVRELNEQVKNVWSFCVDCVTLGGVGGSFPEEAESEWD